MSPFNSPFKSPFNNPFNNRSRVDGSMHPSPGQRDIYDAGKRNQESMNRMNDSMRRSQEAARQAQEAARRAGEQAQDGARRAAQLAQDAARGGAGQNFLNTVRQTQNLNTEGNLDAGGSVGIGMRIFAAVFMCAVAGFFLLVAYHLFFHK
jgi:hypothetical protein